MKWFWYFPDFSSGATNKSKSPLVPSKFLQGWEPVESSDHVRNQMFIGVPNGHTGSYGKHVKTQCRYYINYEDNGTHFQTMSSERPPIDLHLTPVVKSEKRELEGEACFLTSTPLANYSRKWIQTGLQLLVNLVVKSSHDLIKQKYKKRCWEHSCCVILG